MFSTSLRLFTSFSHSRTSWIAQCVVVVVMTSFAPRLWLTYATSVTSGTGVQEDPRVVTVDLYGVRRNWTAVGQQLPSYNPTAFLPRCQSTSTQPTGKSSLNNMAACPWEILTDTDPQRIPRDIRYARCICRNAQVENAPSWDKPWCQENYVNMPYVLCDRDPFSTGEQAHPAPYCQLNMKRVAVSCGAVYGTIG